MFKNWGTDMEDVKTDNYKERENMKDSSENISNKKIYEKLNNETVNTILKGSKLIGDINVTCDLELSGDVEGNITSEQNSNIVIKGTCKGNIETREGNVDIDGELKGGNITAGSNVTISGKFKGGEVRAKGKVHVNGEFNGKLEGKEIEIGANAHGRGELIYKEYISISKGAKIDVQISRIKEELKVVKNPPDKKAADIKPPIKKEISEVK